MKRSYGMLLVALAAATTVLLMTGSAAKNGAQANKLEGVWCASIPSTPEMPLPFRWTYTFIPTDPSGKTAALQGDFIVPLPPPLGLPVADRLSTMFGQGTMTGPDTAKVTGMWYGMKDGTQGPEILYIGISVSEVKFVSPKETFVMHKMAFYNPTPTGRVTPEDKPFLVYPDAVPSLDLRMQQIPLTSLKTE
jgi:hypothetical protein